MRTRRAFFPVIALLAVFWTSATSVRGADLPVKKVYGEWRIFVKPNKGEEYSTLIESRGLPLFKEAGGRMVGWWKTLIGNLYEHLTIWEYDDMAAFERAVDFLGKDKRFAEFAARRDPLLNGEQNRFLTLVEGGERPDLPDAAKFVLHEIHRVPQTKLGQYLSFMAPRGVKILKDHGFRPVGPFTVDVGRWSEITYLFRFESLQERTRLIAEFTAHADAKTYGDAIGPSIEEVTTELLVPAPFAGPNAKTAALERGGISSRPPGERNTAQPTVAAYRPAAPRQIPSRLLPHGLLPHWEQLSDRVFAAGFADRYRSANCGWVSLAERTVLIDLPRGVPIPGFVAEVEKSTAKPVRSLVLTSFHSDDRQAIQALIDRGVNEIVCSPAIRNALMDAAGGGEDPRTAFKESSAHRAAPKAHRLVKTLAAPTDIGENNFSIKFLPADGVAARGGAAVSISQEGVLFAGPLVINGPRAVLAGSDTELWMNTLRQLESSPATHVVPGRGSWGGPKIVARQRRFLSELRRQVAYAVAQGHPQSSLQADVRLPAGDLVWMPYDTPTLDDLDHVYRELTVPIAPFGGTPPTKDDRRPHALVLVGDQPHEPGHLIDGLRPAFEATGVVPHFTVDVNALTAENLALVKLLVILRDGIQRPTDNAASNYMWMTARQQQAVVDFVTAGGAFLNLHNAMGLYPDGGSYLKLVGGRYIGHGPLERFHVEVVDARHPITRGVEDFWVADEQHTPPYDADKVHLLLRNRSDDGKTVAAAGWAYEPGRGRLCHLANGHTREALEHPMYQRLLRNAINWCVRKDDAS